MCYFHVMSTYFIGFDPFPFHACWQARGKLGCAVAVEISASTPVVILPRANNASWTLKWGSYGNYGTQIYKMRNCPACHVLITRGHLHSKPYNNAWGFQPPWKIGKRWGIIPFPWLNMKKLKPLKWGIPNFSGKAYHTPVEHDSYYNIL